MRTACLHPLWLATNQLGSTSPVAPASNHIPNGHTLPETLNPIIQPHNDSTPVGFTPWPFLPHNLELPPNYIISISGESYSGSPDSPAPTIASIQRFLSDFSDNLKSAYPPPNLSPQRASSFHYDLDSGTRYDLAAKVSGIIGLRVPSATVVIALSKLAKEIRRHGPPVILIGLISKSPGMLIPVRHYTIQLDVRSLDEKGLQSGALDQSSGFTATA